MDNKDIVPVDEDMMLGIMMGDTSGYGPVQMPQAVRAVKNEELPSEPHNVSPPQEGRKTYAKKKRREEPESYEQRFLMADSSKDRVTVKIDRELFRRLRALLSVMAPELNLVSYLNNIIAGHLETYSDEIRELYESKFQKPF